MRSLIVVFVLARLAAAQLGLSDNEVQPLNMPQITRLDVDCAKTGMTVNIEFSAPFNGVIFSKGFYSNPSCRYVTTHSGQYDYVFTIPLTNCGTDAFSRAPGHLGAFSNDLDSSGTHLQRLGNGNSNNKAEMFQNTIVIQQDERVQELWDVSRTINCEWQDNLVKTVTSNALSVQMMDSVSLRFAGDDDAVDCWMDLQIGRWPQSVSANSVVRIGEDLSILIYANDPRGKFDMHIKDCYASSSPNFNEPGAISIQLTDYDGCIVKEKLIGPFVYTKTAGSQDDGEYTLLAIAFLQAFKFPDVMDVYLTCNVEICKDKCNNPCQYFYENRQIENTTPSYPPYDGPSGNGRPQFNSPSSPSLDHGSSSGFGGVRSEGRSSTVDYASSPTPSGIGQPVFQTQFSTLPPNLNFPPYNPPANNIPNVPFQHQQDHKGLLFAPGKNPGQRPLPVQQGPPTIGPPGKQQFPVPVNVHPSVFQQGPQLHNNGPQLHNNGPQLHNNGPQLHNNGPQLHNNGPQLHNNGPQFHNGPQLQNNGPPLNKPGPPGGVPSRSIRPPPIRNGRAPNWQGGIPFTFASLPQVTSPSPVYPGPGALPQLPLQQRSGSATTNNNQEVPADSSNLVLSQQIFFPQHRADTIESYRKDGNLAVFLQARKLQNQDDDGQESTKKQDFVQAAAGFKPNNNPYGDNKGKKGKGKQARETDEQLSRSRRFIDVPRDVHGMPERQGKVRVTRSINVVGPSDVRSLVALHNGTLLYLQESDLLPPDSCISTATFATTLSMTLAALFGAIVWIWALHTKAKHGKIFMDIGGVTAYSKS